MTMQSQWSNMGETAVTVLDIYIKQNSQCIVTRLDMASLCLTQLTFLGFFWQGEVRECVNTWRLKLKKNGSVTDCTSHFTSFRPNLSCRESKSPRVQEGSNSASGSMCACHVVALGSIPVARGEACGDLFLALQHWRLCISRGSHDHIYAIYGSSSWPDG